MPLSWDETNGWIFTDEYHDWQDSRGKWGYRSVNEYDISNFGWSAGLVMVKEYSECLSSWPDPGPMGDLDLLEKLMEF